MRLIFFFLCAFLLVPFSSQVHAQTIVTPEFHCLGSCPTAVPTSSANSRSTTKDTVPVFTPPNSTSGQGQSSEPGYTAPVSSNQTTAQTSLTPATSVTSAPCTTHTQAAVRTTTIVNSHTSVRVTDSGSTNQFFTLLLQFLLQLLMQLLGVGSTTPITLPGILPAVTPTPCTATPTASVTSAIAPQIVTATPTPGTASFNPSDRIFTEDFESGNLSKWSNQSCPSGVTIVNTPVRKGSHAVKFTVSDGDTHSKCSSVPTDNPRAQLVSKDLFKDGDEDYIGLSFFFPTGFPNPTDWFQIAEIYGPPFGGSPSMELDVKGDRLGFSRDATHNYDTPWKATEAIKKGAAWEDIVLHIKFSSDPNTGFVEIWRNGVKQTFTNGSQTLHYSTLAKGINWNPGGSNAVFINQYRSSGSKLGTVTLYTDEIYVGKTYASVTR